MTATVHGTPAQATTEQHAAPVRAPSRVNRFLRSLLGPLGAAAAAVALLLSFPPYGLYWLAPVGVALLDLVTRGRRVRTATLHGLLCGAVFFLPLLSWTNLHIGAAPWLLLSGLEMTYFGLLGAAAAGTAALVVRWRWSAALLTAGLWTAQEALRDRTPFGGFPWGRLAFSQSDSPLLRLAALGGAPLVTFAVALVGGLLAVAVRAAARPAGRSAARRAVPAAMALAAAVVLFAAGALVPLEQPAGATVTVALVQGNVPRLGLDFNEQRRAVLDNHVNATTELARRVDAGEVPRPDLVVWPENSSDIDPLLNPDAAQRISAAADAIGAPILIGAVLEGPGAHVRNAAIVWLPHTGPGAMYVKRHPVPFAEYIPMRSLARRITTAVDLVRADFVGGDAPGVLRVGPATLGDSICFEVAYDEIVRDSVTGGGQLITVQTNNATFNEAEARQQLAMVRLRAVEHGREALMVSTVGISGFVAADGSVLASTGFNVGAVEVRALTLGSGRTLATRFGAGPEYLVVILVLGALVIAGVLRRTAAHRSTVAAGSPGDAAPDEEDA